ncbi:hypothetical protein A2125_01260 [Candidatus Woesebacteria bacterium GWB1_43_5]|uniref:Transglycosylase SLT domain-containing protein n=1 Tax=Candidatus Woesebacteria bacterium GWB1_43_5 TaxID=1802474 RepID=A0A1F7WRL7_9BACT|nr:MAG: hypothetical protein A2125_01260 [Candidatus Woesebacteria bacterium GWB1_43_5]
MTSPNFNPIVDAMAAKNANFGALAGIAGNAYNFGGKTITQHVSDAMTNGNLLGKPVLVTETGKIDFGIDELAKEMAKIKGGTDGKVNYLGALLFNAFNTNPSWNSFTLTDPEISSVCGGNCARKIGVNSANFFPQDESFYTRANTHSMGFTLEIANNNLETTLDGIKKAQARGITPVIRIGSGTDSGGFTNPKTYADFLKAIDADPSVSGLVYAIAGPNEPESEPWASPNCRTLESGLKNAKCNEIVDPEFHSLRPYPANPCDSSVRETTYMCSNQFVAKETFRVSPNSDCSTRADGSRICSYNFQSTVRTSVNLDDSFLPILGNTELVPNSQQKTGTLDLKQRVNDYVSWYLNGAPTLTEEEDRNPYYDTPSEQFIYNLVNLSGPIKKLMPWGIQAEKRIETIQEGFDSRNNNAGIRHDQIVGCKITALVTGDLPTPCYNTPALTLYAMRLTDWLSPTNSPFPFPSALYLRNGISIIKDLLPPLEEDFPNIQELIKAYKTWRDNVICSPTVFGFFTCSPKRISPWWSNLFQNIPFSSTEDRKGTAETQQPPGRIESGTGDESVIVDNITYTPANADNKEILYFPHIEEVAELSAFLQKTFTPRGESGNTNTKMDSESPTIGPGCAIVETRSNPGDDLHAENESEGTPISGTLSYNASFNCVFPSNNTGCITSCVDGGKTLDNCTQQCASSNTCTKDIYVGIPMGVQTPKIEEIWNRLVEGDFSVFKRFLPKFGADAPFEKLKDIPGVTTGIYTAEGGSGQGTLTAIAGDESQQRSGESAEIYFPHVGSLSEYFLKGIQAALRPKGFGESALSGQQSAAGTTQPGRCEAATSGSCSVGNLLSYFNNDQIKASNASQICNVESGGSEFALNDGCLSGKTYDFSVGLFQINLLAHRVVDPTTNEVLNCPSAFSSKDFETRTCIVGNQNLLDRCVDILQNAERNIQKAVEISSSGTNWNPWSAAGVCGLISGFTD